MTNWLRHGAVGAAVLALATILTAPVTFGGVDQEKFFKAIRKHDNKKVARYLERGLPDEMLLAGLKVAIRAASSRNAVLIVQYVEADDEALLLALQRKHSYPKSWNAMMEEGSRFTDPETLHAAIRDDDGALVAEVLEHGRGLDRAVPAVGLRPTGPLRETVTVEKYEDPNGMTALLLAVRQQDAGLVKRLLEAGADPDAVVIDEPGSVAEIDAASLDIGQRVTIDDPARVTPPSRTTALIEAVRQSEMELVATLLAGGASPEVVGSDGRDACAWAKSQQRPGYLPGEMLLALCPDVRFIDAARNGRLDDMKAYLDAGGDANTADSTGWTALHAASGKGHVEAIALLLERGADVDRRMTEESGLPTPLFAAAWDDGHPEAVRALVAAGADIEAVNDSGERPLHVATDLDVIRILVEEGADIQALGRSGVNAMTLANQRMDLAAVDFFRARGLSYGPGFASPAPSGGVNRQTSSRGHPAEGVLARVDAGVITLRGQWASNRVEDVECTLTGVTRDARYFHAPSLVDRSLPKERPLLTLTDDELRAYVGRIVRAGALDGVCTSLQLPSARPVETVTAEQLAQLVETAEFQGELFNVITTGRMTMVVPGVLRAFRDQVVLVELDGGLKVRCKLTGATGGILYRDDKTGTRSRLNALVFERPEALLETVGDSEIRGHVGRRVKVGPGAGRCEYFEMVGFENKN